MKEPHIHTPAHDPARREEYRTYGSFDPALSPEDEAHMRGLLHYQTQRIEPKPFPGSAAWWRANYKARGVPKPDWWERTTCLPWDEEKADG